MRNTLHVDLCRVFFFLLKSSDDFFGVNRAKKGENGLFG